IDSSLKLKNQDTPDKLLINDEIIRTIQAAIEDLPEEMKEAITLREFDGMSYEDIAITMECPVGTVRSRIFRAREAIDKKLKPVLDKR
ncbi:MAG: sigma-70 family RNA polymerase sigma factor, partial [Methyloprofundus sp.]|nr:sigma-70 family RNA polymerase sigma factor [Methyloprofundus sp.]